MYVSLEVFPRNSSNNVWICEEIADEILQLLPARICEAYFEGIFYWTSDCSLMESLSKDFERNLEVIFEWV